MSRYRNILAATFLVFCAVNATARVENPVVVIEGAGVLDVRTGTLTPDLTLLIRDGRIETISAHGEVETPDGSIVVDGRGLVALPGLHDMHVHIESRAFAAVLGMPETEIDHEAAMISYLANGITTIQVCSGADDLLELRQSIARGEILAPRLVLGSPMLAGDPPILPPPVTRVVLTAEDGKRAAREFQRAGYDFIKLRENLPLAAFEGVTGEARRLGIRVAGHVPKGEGLDLARVLAVGSYGVLHLEELIGPQPQTDAGVAAIAHLVKENGGEVVTTLTVMANLLDKLHDYEATLAQPEIRYMHPLVKGLWHNNPFHQAVTPEGLRRFEQWQVNQQRLLVQLVEQGVVVMAGTDALNPTIVPGFSFHRELALMVDAGLTPTQALRAATTVPDRFLTGRIEGGVIMEGAPADLVLVTRNPIDDLETLRKPAGVVVGGRWLSAEEIDRRLATAAAAFASASPVVRQEATTLEDRLNELLRSHYPSQEPGAAVLITIGENEILRRGYGLANVEHGVPVRPDTVFRIASITKVLTAYALLEMVEENHLALTTRVGDVLVGYPRPGAEITVEQLLQHESGLPRIYDLFVAHSLEDLSPREVTTLFQYRPLDSQPGTSRSYSNANYIVLAAMLEEIEQENYGQIMRRWVFQPLGMTHSGVAQPGSIVPNRAAGYTKGKTGRLRNAPYFSPSLSSAAGALLSSVDDLALFERAVGRDCGWQAATVAGHPALEHGGSSIGWVSAVLWVPSQDLFVTILSNRGFDPEPTGLARKLAMETLQVLSARDP